MELNGKMGYYKMHMYEFLPNKIGRTYREDGIIVSTVEPKFMTWYGKYETAVSFDGGDEWKIAEGYNTRPAAKAGHKKYANMTAEELKNLDWIG